MVTKSHTAKTRSRKSAARRAPARAAHRAKAATKPKANATRSSTRRWSRRVMQTSDALDLEPDVFKQRDPKRIARSLKRSAERSTRRKASPFRSAMSMLNFYVNRGGKNLSASQRAVLQRAKEELRALYHRAASETR